MTNSVFNTATEKDKVEVLFYVDDDDLESAQAIEALSGNVGYKRGPRIRLMTQYWNELLSQAKGDLFMQGNDDVIFRTPGWDVMVEHEFANSPDKILLVHGSDEGMHFDKFGAHSIVHKNWVDTVGYFIPPYFSSDFGDKWINDVANALNRRKYLPFIVEHMHFMFNKAHRDSTTNERLDRHQRDNPEKTWNDTSIKRMEDIGKLRSFINEIRAKSTGQAPEAAATQIPPLTPSESLPVPQSLLGATKYCDRCGSQAIVPLGTQSNEKVFRCNGCGRQIKESQLKYA
jgi:hypothetical protein